MPSREGRHRPPYRDYRVVLRCPEHGIQDKIYYMDDPEGLSYVRRAQANWVLNLCPRCLEEGKQTSCLWSEPEIM